MKLSMNVTSTFYGTAVNDIEIAKAVGFDGIELQSPKLYRYLDAGYEPETLLPHLQGIEVSGIGALQEAEPETFKAEAVKLATIGEKLGAPCMQMCPGPVDVEVVKDFRAGRLRDDDPRFRGLLGRSDEDVIAETAKNVALAADVAADHGLDLFLEPLGWAPVNRLHQALEILERIDRPNAKIVVDFWHFWVTGDTPEDVAALDPSLISAVHVCDGVPVPAGEIPDQGVSRNVWTGGGSIPLQEWVDAVRSTGYDGWYCSEIFHDRSAELDFTLVAQTLLNEMRILTA